MPWDLAWQARWRRPCDQRASELRPAVGRMAGFTLLELLIAIAIFALLGMATYRMLDSVLSTDARTRAHEQHLRALVRALSAFERDLSQVLARPVRGASGEPLPAFLSTDTGLELSRAGWRNPLGAARSNVQRVRWQHSGEHWQRLYWSVLDQAQDSQPQVQDVLDDVVRLRFRYLDGEGRWLDTWPSVQGAESTLEALPVALELLVEHRRYGEIRRLLRLPDALPDGADETAPGKGPVQGSSS